MGFLLSLFLLPVLAVEVGLAGATGTRALLIINGGDPVAVAVGQTVEGVRVVSIQDGVVVIESDGRKRSLRVGQNAVSTGPAGSDRAVITSDQRGHFVTVGKINGVNVRFIVDTGASMIALGSSDAAKLGLDWSRGERGYVQTANGRVAVTRVKLNTVQVGGLAVHDVDAAIHDSNLPIALLGMSFLNRTDMQIEGSLMTLKKR